MAEYVDLDLLVSENMEFKIGGEFYEIPLSYDTETVLQMHVFEQDYGKALKAKDVKKLVEILDKMVYLLFSQLNDVDENWVKKLHSTQKNAIFSLYQKRMNEINTNPNYNSLLSQK